MSIIITEMKRENIPQAALIEERTFSMPWSQKAFEESMTHDYMVFLMAYDEETKQMIGYIGMYTSFGDADITNIAVLPEYRGKGIGSKLIDAIFSKAREKHITHIRLEVRQSNEQAIKLYERKGFAKIGIRKDFYQKPIENAFIMVKNNV